MFWYSQQARVRSVLLQIGGSGVLVQPMTYIFDEEPLRWQRLLENLGETHELGDSVGIVMSCILLAVLSCRPMHNPWCLFL